MREIKVKLYQYDELNEKAKEKALEWFLEGCFDYNWYECTYEDAKNVGLKITSFDCDRGNSITGEIITSAPEVIEDILAEHGKTCDTYKTAKSYESTFKRLEEMRDKDHPDFEDEFEKAEKELLHDLLEDYLVTLRHEVEYMQGREYLEDGIRANEYEFTENGKRA